MHPAAPIMPAPARRRARLKPRPAPAADAFDLGLLRARDELRAVRPGVRLPPRLLVELSQLFGREADSLHDAYAWPPLPPPSEETLAEQDRLNDVAIELEERGRRAGWGDRPAADAVEEASREAAARARGAI